MSLESSQKNITNANSNDEITTSFIDDDKILQYSSTNMCEINDLSIESIEKLDSFVFNTDSCDYNKEKENKFKVDNSSCKVDDKSSKKNNNSYKTDNSSYKIDDESSKIDNNNYKDDNIDSFDRIKCDNTYKYNTFDTNQIRIKYRREKQWTSDSVNINANNLPFYSLQNETNKVCNENCEDDSQKYINDDFDTELSFLDDIENLESRKEIDIVWESTTQDDTQNKETSCKNKSENKYDEIFDDFISEIFCTDDFEITNDEHEFSSITDIIETRTNNEKEHNSITTVETRTNKEKDHNSINSIENRTNNEKEYNSINTIETRLNKEKNMLEKCDIDKDNPKNIIKQINNIEDNEYIKKTITSEKAIINNILNNENLGVSHVKNSFTGFTTGNNKKICIKEESIIFANKLNNEVCSNEIQNKNDVYKKNHKNINTFEQQTKVDIFRCSKSTQVTTKENGLNKQAQVNTQESERCLQAPQTNPKKCKSNINENTSSSEKTINVQEKQNIDGNKNLQKTSIKESQSNEKLSIKNILKTQTNCNTKFTPPSIKNKLSFASGLQKSKLPSGRPMRSYLMPEVGHTSTEKNYIKNLKNIYKTVQQNFTGKNNFAFANHFKWSWMHFFGTNINEIKLEMHKNYNFDIKTSKFYKNMIDFLLAEIKKRFKKEYSILKRIVEGDDVSMKYMVLAVIEIKKEVLHVFDGFYAVNVKIDTDLQKMLISQKIRIGTYLRVFGAKLITQNKSLVDTGDECVLSLNYNNVKICKRQTLGYQKKKGYCIQIKDITKTGGDICGLEVKITKIIERKIQIKVNSYVNIVNENEIEKEVEKIEKLIKDAQKNNGKSTEPKPVYVFKKVVKLLVQDVNKNECLLTWYDCEEVAVNECYRFCLLKIGKGSIGLHLVTGFSTVAMKIKKLNNEQI